IVGVRFFGISRGVFRYLERLVSHSVNLKVLSEIRVWFYKTIEPLAPARLKATRSGDLLQRATGDIDTLENFYVRCVSPIIVALITGALACVFLGTIFPPLSWIFAAGLAVNGIVLPAGALFISRRNSKALVQTRADASAGMVEFVQSLGDLQVFGAEKRVLAQVNETADRYTNKLLRNTLQNSMTDGLGVLVIHLTVLAALWAIIPGVNRGELSGVFLAVVALFVQAGFEGVTPLPLAAQQLGASLEAAGRLFELAAPAQPLAEPETKSQPIFSPTILKVDHLSFDFGSGDDWALRDLSFTLERGKKIALIGPSGAGKSSLVDLILRFWIPDHGSIWLDQTNIAELDE
ncbi:ATP-binding cassette domain-containing protein, partial [bacterium]